MDDPDGHAETSGPKPERQSGDPPYRCLWCSRWRCRGPLEKCAGCDREYRDLAREMPEFDEITEPDSDEEAMPETAPSLCPKCGKPHGDRRRGDTCHCPRDGAAAPQPKPAAVTPDAPKIADAYRAHPDDDPLAVLHDFAESVARMGGIATARKALDTLETIRALAE
jgi:hypothetical protein